MSKRNSLLIINIYSHYILCICTQQEIMRSHSIPCLCLSITGVGYYPLTQSVNNDTSPKLKQVVYKSLGHELTMSKSRLVSGGLEMVNGCYLSV